MAAIAEGERRGIGRAERIGTMAIVGGAVARMRQGGVHTLAVIAGVFGAGWALQAAADAAGMDLARGGVTPAYVAYLVGTTLISGLGAALAVRLFLRGPKGLLRVDRGLLECAGVMAALTFQFQAISLGRTFVANTLSPAAVAASSYVILVVYLLAVFVLLRLTLWPVCRLMGRNEVTVAAGWRLMRRATRGLIFGYLIFMIPFGLVIAVNWGPLMAGGGQLEGWRQALFLAVGAAYGVACYAMSATIYALRVEAPATVADVFD